MIMIWVIGVVAWVVIGYVIIRIAGRVDEPLSEWPTSQLIGFTIAWPLPAVVLSCWLFVYIKDRLGIHSQGFNNFVRGLYGARR